MAVYNGVTTAGDVVALPQDILDVYSKDIEFSAIGIMMFDRFCVTNTDLQAEPGETVTFTKFADITGGGAILEKDDLSETFMTAAQTNITVTEYGHAIGVTEKLIRMASDDEMRKMAILLGRNYAKIVDNAIRDTVYSSTNVIYGGSKVSRAAMDGAADFFSVEDVRRAVTQLQTNNAPKFVGRAGEAPFYICFLSPWQAGYLKRDPDWISANNYANTRAVFTGEIGRWEDVVFIATTWMLNGVTGAEAYDATLHNAATGGASNADVHKAVIFGDGAVAHAIALPVEMRQKAVTDYGRKHGLAWYSIMGFGLLDEDYIINIETV